MIDFEWKPGENGPIAVPIFTGVEAYKIPEEGKVSPFRLTEGRIIQVIKGITFTVMPSGKAVVCELTLENGFTVRGESAVVDKKNFVLEVGQRISFTRAVDKVWEVEGYLMQQRKYESENK